MSESTLTLDRYFELSPDMLCMADFDGRFVRVNPKMASVLGYAADELLSRGYLDLPHPNDVPALQQLLADLATRNAVSRVELRLRRADGQYLWTDWHAWADPESSLIYAMGRDVTASRAIEQQLQQARRMNAIGNLASGIAHDFNNLLQSILANASFILMDGETGSASQDHAQEILHAAERGAALTAQLLTFAQQRPATVRPISLNVIARQLMTMLRRLIPENIEIDLIEGHALALVSADPSQLEQVLVNLCVNARDAMPQGGRVTIETENVLINGNYRELHPWAKPGRYVLLTVTDTGVGMSEEVRDRIFEPFFSTKNSADGTGLGLSTVYGVVQQHGGFVHVYSEPGKGTTFKIYLPATERRAGEVGTKLEPAVVGGHETILVAEDDALVRNIVERVLARYGYRVVLAADGAEAVQVYRERGDIDLVLLDVVMPKVSGPAAARTIRESDPGARVLLTSGYADPRVIGDEAIDHEQLIGKPFEPDELLRRIRATLDGREGS